MVSLHIIDNNNNMKNVLVLFSPGGMSACCSIGTVLWMVLEITKVIIFCLFSMNRNTKWFLVITKVYTLLLLKANTKSLFVMYFLVNYILKPGACRYIRGSNVAGLGFGFW